MAVNPPVTVTDLSNKGAKAANIASSISAGGDFAATAINLIAGISDQNKRRQFEQNFTLLGADQQKRLNNQLIEANSETERLRILTSALTAANVQRISNISNVFADQERKKRNETLLVAGIVLLVGVGAIFIIYKKA
jgi:hypothetical protein